MTDQQILPKITLAIITKNRPSELRACLDSLVKQTIPVDELLIVDSGTKLPEQYVKETYRKYFRKLTYLYEPRSGFPFARNRALITATYQWLAFTDDDCVVDGKWIEQMKQAIQKFPRAAAIAGLSKTFYPCSPVARAAELNELYWKTCARRGTAILDLEALDNKNVVYNTFFLHKHAITYDEKRAPFYAGASDDCDLGMQIQKAGGKAYYCESMIIYHKDPQSLQSYVRGKIFRTSAHATYERQWKDYRDSLQNRKTPERKWNFFRRYVKVNQINLPNAMVLLLLLGLTFIIIRYTKIRYVLLLYGGLLKDYGEIIIFATLIFIVSKCIRGFTKITGFEIPPPNLYEQK